MSTARFGAFPAGDGVLFRVWAATSNLKLVVDGHPHSPFTRFRSRSHGIREILVPGLKAGARYGYLLDEQGPFPDPASRFQPDGVHALSEVVDSIYSWTDREFRPHSWAETVIYELHCGTFTPEGTYRAAAERLPYLRDLGITAVELMPLADCPGRWNWGYDGVSLYAPNRNYGRPADLRNFVDQAHHLGLSVFLDVVYNHLGPDGAYHRLFHPAFYSQNGSTPWGECLSYACPDSRNSRAFFLENGLYWLEEFHIDGFRLDATHAIHDDSPQHFLAEFSTALRKKARSLGREVVLIAEDSRNLTRLLEPVREGGDAMDAVWADDFHHHMRRALAEDRHGYFQDFGGQPSQIAKTLRNGWYFEGQLSRYHSRARGTPTGALDRSRFVICIQNHDQVGNRAKGERLNHQTSPHAYRAGSALLLSAPETPLLFMGQEWAASSPFQFFTDHHGELGLAVTAGRLREFASFPEFSDELARAAIPDPQAETTFLRSKLNWEEIELPPHAAMLRWYQRLLCFRRSIREAGLSASVRYDGQALIVEWRGKAMHYVLLVSLHGPTAIHGAGEFGQGTVLFTSEDGEFTAEGIPPRWTDDRSNVEFSRAGAMVIDLRGER